MVLRNFVVMNAQPRQELTGLDSEVDVLPTSSRKPPLEKLIMRHIFLAGHGVREKVGGYLIPLWKRGNKGDLIVWREVSLCIGLSYRSIGAV